jgi:hypothetical protein
LFAFPIFPKNKEKQTIYKNIQKLFVVGWIGWIVSGGVALLHAGHNTV